MVTNGGLAGCKEDYELPCQRGLREYAAATG
jgi:hypothetical protein